MIEARRGGSRAPLALAAALLALTGIAALIVQTLWLRELRLALGGASSALAATLAALVIGQAGGARLGERSARRAVNPLRAFGLLALAAGIGALATPHLMRGTSALLDARYDALLAWPALLALARGAAALLATLPATLALGALAPCLFAATLGGTRTLASTGVALYALNALASAAGAALATFALVERLGSSGTLAFGACGLGLAGAAASAASLRAGRVPPLVREADSLRPRGVPLPGWLLQLAALSGFGTFAAQGLFAQALGRVSNQSAYAFGTVLVIALACTGLGALFTFSLPRRAQPQLALGVALAITGGAFLIFPAAFAAATGGLTGLSVEAPWPAYPAAFAALAFATTAPVLLAAACVFPLLLTAAAQHAPRDGRSLAAATARLLARNALGALVGAVLAPLLLIPGLGLFGAVAFLGFAYLLGSIGPIARASGPRFGAYAAILGLLIALVVRPGTQPALRVPRGERLVAFEESAAGLVAVFDGDDGLKLQLDNHYLLGGARDRVRQERQGHLPLLLHPRPQRVLFLGSATGSSASAALAHDVASITLVELVPGVARAARRWFRAENRGVYDDPRTRVVADDARSFLRASPEQFDVIVGDLFVPWQSGSGSLFAAEHFANARKRLADGGVFCQWLPLYQLSREEFLLVARAFARSFPAADLFRGDFYGTHPIVALCGSTSDEWRPPKFRSRGMPQLSDRWVAHAAGPASLYIGRVDATWLGEGAAETDAEPRLELSAARAHSGRSHAPFVGVTWAEFSLSIASSEVARGGLLLQAASALYAAGRFEEAEVAFSNAAQLLPPELVRDAPPDPSVAELWHTRSD